MPVAPRPRRVEHPLHRRLRVLHRPPAVAPSLYVVQAHGMPVVQSTDPAGGFFGRAPPIFANSSSFEPGQAIVPFGVQNSMSVSGPQ